MEMKLMCLHPCYIKEHVLSFGQVTFNFSFVIISYDTLARVSISNDGEWSETCVVNQSSTKTAKKNVLILIIFPICCTLLLSVNMYSRNI